MKVQGLPVVFARFGQVQAKREDQPARQDSGRNRDQRHRDEDGQAEGEEGGPYSEQQMSEAVALFAADPQSRANGLQASTEGAGPGLRVTLKNSDGNVIRQFTGEEFMRLRETVTQGRGKILDQKI